MKFISRCLKTLSPAVPKLLLLTGLTISFASCQSGDEITALVQPNQDDVTAQFTDSNTVVISTMVMDSMMTGSTSRLLVGRYTDPVFGKMYSIPFFQFGYPTNGISIPETAVYDSLIVSLKYDGYYYGDTTKAVNVTVHELTKDLTLNDDGTSVAAVYNTTTTPYNPTPIGRKRFYPSPYPSAKAADAEKRPDVKIRLSDTMGKTIFQMVRESKLTNSEEWINYLKGLTIIPASTDNSSVVGFNYLSGNTSIQLHYHIPNEGEGFKEDSTVFGYTTSQYIARYNSFKPDRKGTILEKLPKTYRSVLPSSQADNLSFVQAGAGIMTRIDLPGIREFKYGNNNFVNSATLIIEPLRSTITPLYPAPPNVRLYLCDENNDYVLESGSPITGAANADFELINDVVGNRQYYAIDVTNYVKTILASSSMKNYGLLLRTSNTVSSSGYFEANTEFSKSFDRMVIPSQQHERSGVKLQIRYISSKIN